VTRLRKKAVEVDGYEWFRNGDHPEDGPRDQEGAVVKFFKRHGVNPLNECSQCTRPMGLHGWIDTLEGGHVVCPGDTIITGVEGERYPIKPGIRNKTYDVVKETRP
jgi:hypothetical protein